MALLKYFKLKTSRKQLLPNPNGELSAKIPSSGISSANACVGKLLVDDRPRDEQDSGRLSHRYYSTRSLYNLWLSYPELSSIPLP